MKFLYPGGGDIDNAFGVIASPGKGIPKGIKVGLPWAADNQAFTKGFNSDLFFPWLESLQPFKHTCLFVVVPDVVGDAIQTLDNWRHWRRYFARWPVAFVAQDGQEHLSMPTCFDVLFIGGGTEWKESQGAVDCINRANGANIHVGRVNTWRRYRHFRRMLGAETWTCDGTRVKYERDKALKDWRRYMAQPPLITI